MRKALFYISVMILSPATLPAQDVFVPVAADAGPVAEGKYAPSWESLSQYEVPEWFRDAKFGMWVHRGAQCVEGSGDWMARGLYEGSRTYGHHVKNYGHPSEFGFFRACRRDSGGCGTMQAPVLKKRK